MTLYLKGWSQATKQIKREYPDVLQAHAEAYQGFMASQGGMSHDREWWRGYSDAYLTALGQAI